MTILLTTHYLEEADRLASMLAIIDRGTSWHVERPTSSRASFTATRSRSSSPTPATRRASAALRGVDRSRRGPARRPRDPCPRAERRRGDPRRARRARRAGRDRDGGDARSPIARRRVPAPRRPRVSPDERHAGGGRMTALRQTWQVYLRGVRVFIRQPAYLGMTLIQPIIWLLLFGALFKAVTRDPRLSRQLLHRLPDSWGGRHVGRVLRRLGRDGVHRRHSQRRDGPDARLAGVARRTERGDGRCTARRWSWSRRC